MFYTLPGKKVLFEFLSGYTAQNSPTKFQFYDIEFDLYDGVNPPKLPVSFNFGAGQPLSPVIGAFNTKLDDVIGTFSCKVINPAIAVFNVQLDDVVGAFSGKVTANFGVFNVALDDCVGYLHGNYDSNVNRSLFSGVNSKQESTNSARLNTSFLQSNAVKNVISVTAQQESTTQLSAKTASIEQNTLKVSTEKLSWQDSTLQISAKTSFKHEQAIPKKMVLSSVVETALPLNSNTNADLHQLIPIGSRFEFVVEDVNDATHVFNFTLNKQMPSQYWYTPAAVFRIAAQPLSRVFSLAESIYQAVSPIAFNLVSSVSNAPAFDLGWIDVKSVTTIRAIFDSVSTYTAAPDFVYPFTDAKKQLTESVQRGGYRLSTTAATKKATPFGRKSCFKSEKTKILYNQRQVFGGGTIIDLPRPPITPKPTTITFTIPRKTVYTMQHTITATLLDLTPLDVSDIALNLDADSWAWTFSCRLLNAGQLPLVVKSDGTAVQIIITINGYSFNVLVEKVTRNRTFAKNSISLSGRSLTALLTQPYVQPASATQSDLMSVQQLVDLELPFDWEIGFWSAANWNIPAGAFSYTTKTPIQVIVGIAADIGAVVVPSRHSKKIDVMPRYPVLPWNYDSETPDLVIPDAVIESLTYRNVVPAQGNAVYVHGSDIGGVLARCRLTGTAGDKLLQTITNSLMTDVIGCRGLGERLLAAQWEQPAIQFLTIPLNATDIPLAKIGDLVRIDIDEGHVFGVVNSLGISANLGKVSQTITIGEETANVWQGFKDLLPRDPLLVGTLASTDGQTSLMTLIDGGVIRVRGTGIIDSKYYIRAGRIENQAPNLEVSEIVI
jgi:hypothetical protein